jgi:DNA-directed RNA polymerase specialized sigma24 family protein
MAATESSETDLDDAFEEGADFGIRYLDSEFRERVLRHIKWVGRGFLNYHDLLDVYQETLIAMHARAQDDEFEPCRSLRMVFAIARNKSIDLLRERGYRINLDEDAILDIVAADTKGSDLVLQWRLHVFPIEQRELREILIEFISQLPRRQRIVAQCYIDHFEDFRPSGTKKSCKE